MYKVLHENINTDFKAKMIQQKNKLRTQLVLNHKPKEVPHSPFAFLSQKGYEVRYPMFVFLSRSETTGRNIKMRGMIY